MAEHFGQTTDEHRARHVVLHNHLDELMADFILAHRDKRPSNTTVMELLQWSHRQTTEAP